MSLQGKIAFKGERGYSNYELAVKNGYIGTEEEWLSQLTKNETVHASTSNREQAIPNPKIGTMMFDDTLKKPIWYDGTKWIDATGTEV